MVSEILRGGGSINSFQDEEQGNAGAPADAAALTPAAAGGLPAPKPVPPVKPNPAKPTPATKPKPDDGF
jgi:hypothetical protein